MLMTVNEFYARTRDSMGDLVLDLQAQTGRVGEEEAEAWSESLPPTAKLLHSMGAGAMHVSVGGRGPSVSLEYRLPASSSWSDVVLLGRGTSNPAGVILELKHWDLNGDAPGPSAGLIRHRGKDHLHPSEQVAGYVEYCQHFHDGVQTHGADVHGCVLFTGRGSAQPYRSGPHRPLVERFPVFEIGGRDTDALERFLASRVSTPDDAWAQAFENGTYRQDRNLIAQMADAMTNDTDVRFVLLDHQRLGFEQVMMRVSELLASSTPRKTVLAIEGPPGSGKSVLAARLWAALAKDDRIDGSVVFVTTSASQKSNWNAIFDDVSQSRFGHGAVMPANRFNPGLTPKWQSEMKKAGHTVTVESWRENLKLYGRRAKPKIPDNTFSVAIVDEAHALIDPTIDGKRGIPPSGWAIHAGPQAWHVIRASKVSVFLLDSRQSYRDNETTTLANIHEYALAQGAEVGPTVSLADSQFRCAGSVEYLKWLDALLARTVPVPTSFDTTWRRSARPTATGAFEFEVVDTPFDLDDRLREQLDRGHSVRLVAAYGRKWKTKPPKDDTKANPHDSGQFDFDIATRVAGKTRHWRRVWNFAPEQDYKFWVQAPEGSPMHDDPLCEVGCPYVVRGFDYDYVGVLWLKDLVRRGDRWVPQLDHVHESAWKKTIAAARDNAIAAKTDLERHGALSELAERLLRGYRILLSRAQKGTYVWCEDAETRAYLESALGAGSAARPAAPLAPVVPISRARPKPQRPREGAVPLVRLDLAAGAFSSGSVPDASDAIAPRTRRPLTADMFVARVKGRSMEPLVADGALCLFRLLADRSPDGKVVLVERRGVQDPELQGAYTLKRWTTDPGDVVVLRPENSSFEPIRLSPSSLESVRAVAELIEVVTTTAEDA